MAARYRQFMANADRTSAAYERNKERFITSSLDDAIELTDEQKVRINEVTKKKMSYFRKLARSKSAKKKVWMQDQIQNGPKVEIYVEPVVQMGRSGEQQVVAMEGILIGLNGVQVYLTPGKNLVHPLIAQRYEQIKRGKAETSARQRALQGTMSIDSNWQPGQPDGWSRVAKAMENINKEFGSSSGSGEKGDRWDSPELGGGF